MSESYGYSDSSLVLDETLKRPTVVGAARHEPAQPAIQEAAVKASSKRVLYLDVLRVVAAIAVVLVHTSANLIYTVSMRSTLNWRTAIVIDSASRWCVPIYVMLSGAFMLTYRKRYTTEQFIRTRLMRIVVPFAAWLAIYLAWLVFDRHSIKITTWRDLWDNIASPPIYHLWFFYMIIGLYLLTPALSIIVQHASRRLLWSLTALTFVGVLWNTQYPFTQLASRFTQYVPFTVEMGYLGYFLLGYLLVSGRQAPRWARLLLYALGILSTAATALTAYKMSAVTFNDPLSVYLSLTTLAQAVAVFTFCRAVNWERALPWKWQRQLLNTLALSTFGIYLIHVMVKYYVENHIPLVEPITSVRYQLIAPWIIFAVSAALAVPLRKTPIIKYLMP
jgi:surface polysaccharide O-acyltransferase-like enzyme